MPEPAHLPERCAYFRAITSARLDVELPPLELALHSAHLAACADCRRHAAELTVITAGIRAAPPQRPGRAIPLTAGRRSWPRRPLAASALALVVATSLGGARAGPGAEVATSAAAGSAAKAV